MDAQFRILGPIEVDLADGRRARVPRGRPLSFLGLLLVRRGRAIAVERIVDELWEGAGPRHARNAVQVLASRLRTALGEDLVVYEGGGYALRIGTLDAEQFEERFALGRDELACGEPWDAATTLHGALELWRGPTLADVADERFAQPEIARLDDLRLSCLSDRIDADLACGRHAEVAGELDALVQEHPLRERLRGQQMLALYHTGCQADALSAYRDARRALVDGLGIEPSPRLRELEAAILRQDVPEPAPPPRRSAPRHSRRWVTCASAQLADPDELAGLDPESLRASLEQLQAVADTACRTHEGSVVELRSDAILAVFGIPVAHEDDALRAVRAARELTGPLPFGLRARCGLCTGEVVVASSPPVIGEAAATAERLARSAAPGEIRLAESTWQSVRHAARAAEHPDGGYVLRAIDPDAPAIGRRLDLPLIGRETEVDLLRDTYARVVAEHTPELLTVLGEPGIGKSRLVAELHAIAGESGTVLTGRCPAYGQGITFWPLREAVLQVRGDRALDELAAELAIPAVAVRRVAAAVGIEEGEAGEDTDWAFRVLFGALARERPLVLVVDDAHWAEPALLDLLLELLARLADVPVLVVWVARPDQLARRPERGVELVLRSLSRSASESLVAALGGVRLEPEEDRRIIDAAGGNPLYLEQLVAYVGEGQSADALPPALHALLAARLDALDEAERSALALAAITGDRFEPNAVHALAAGLTRAAVEQACGRLVARDLLVADGHALRFRHALIRDVAYASLAKSARARLHERHADWLAALGSRLPEADARIGFHLEAACRFADEVGEPAPPELSAEAGRRLAAAARTAHGRGDLPGEIGFLDRAVVMLGGDGHAGAALLPDLVSALLEAGESERAETLAERAVSISASLGLEPAHSRALIERERIRLSCHPETFGAVESMRVTAQAAATLRELGDDLGRARAAFLMSDLTWLIGDPVASYGHAEEMLALARRAGSDFEAATALMFMSWCLVEGPWPALEGIARCDALAAEAIGLRRAELTLLGCRAVLVSMTGRYDEARADMARARVGLGELGVNLMDVYLALLEAIAETLAGEPAAAERAVRDAAAMVSASSDRWHHAMVGVDLAHALIAQGRDATEAVEQIEAAPAPCDLEWVVKRHAARAWVAAQAGDSVLALEEARAAVATAEPSALILVKADAISMLARVLARSGDAPGAAAAAERAISLYDNKGNVVAAEAARRQLFVAR